jgi:hypothetical protein
MAILLLRFAIDDQRERGRERERDRRILSRAGKTEDREF